MADCQNLQIYKSLLPPLEMQEKITFAISKIEEKIQILNSSLENLQAHKNKILQNTLNLIKDV